MDRIKENWSAVFNPFLHPIRFGAVILLIGSIWIALCVAVTYLMSPVCLSPSQQLETTVTIREGATLKEIGDALSEKGLIKNSAFFVYYVRLTGKEKSLQAGVYRISNAWSVREIVECLSSGRVISYRITIPEGYTVAQIGDLLARKGIVERDLFEQAAARGDFSFPFLDKAAQGPRRLEGYLFPDTYEVRPGMSAEEIIRMMLERFASVFTPELQERARALGLSSRDVVTLASIVEREAKLDEERPLIAAVFLNRLRQGMRLESCATVQYVLSKQKETLTLEDLRTPSPYNTYLHEGLPPGPIANPGLPSLKAVLYPAEVDYLYFVARGDGSHYFSTTYGEHQMAARRYQGN